VSSGIEEVVVGATKRNLVVQIVDENSNPIDLQGGSVKLQGKSSDLPSVTIDVSGTLTSPASGIATFFSIGTLVTSANLSEAGITEATFRLRVKYTDSQPKFDYGDEFQIKWVQTPV